MSYFSAPKGERSMKPLEPSAPEPKISAPAPARLSEREIVSTFGSGLLITGNVASTGAVQIFGRVVGDVHAAHLIVSKGGSVEGNIRAQDVVIDGNFKGTIHGNSVKLQSTAAVEGEIYNRSLSIDQSAHFEGVARRLNQPVEAPSSDQVTGKAAEPAAYAPTAPLEPVHREYAVNGNGMGNGALNGHASNLATY